MRKHRLWAYSIAVAILLALAGCDSDETSSTPTPTPEPSPVAPSKDLPGVIAFASDRGSGYDVYTVNAADGLEAQITDHEGDDKEPAWSPDGSKIAFQSGRDGSPDVYLMNSDGTDPISFRSGPELQGGPRWSPDGSRIAYYTLLAAEVGFLWVGQVDGPDNFPLLQSIHPTEPETHCGGGFPGGWIDNETVLFRGSWGEGGALEICTVKTDMTEINPISSERDVFAFYPAISPDGTAIAFSRQPEGQSHDDIYLMSVEGRNARSLFATSESDSYPTWSPDGEWVAFASTLDGDSEIYAIRKDGTDLRQLTNNDHPDIEPSWSPVTP